MKFKPGDRITMVGKNSSRRIFLIHDIVPYWIPPRPAYQCYPQDDYANRDWVHYGVEETDNGYQNGRYKSDWRLVLDPQEIMKQIL